MYCTSCGKELRAVDAFCPHCGGPTAALARLVAAARTGDQSAVSALYEETYSKVFYTVRSIIKDEDAVFDVLQDTYIKAFAGLGSFEGDKKFLPWVRRIAVNTARDWLRKKRPMLFTELGSGDEQDTPAEEMFPDERGENLPEEVIDTEETKRLLREIIGELPEDQRAVIGMFYYEEMSVRDIAESLGVTESAVKSRLMYGRKKIEKKVRELEKRGTKLYGLSPIPFLLLLLRNQKVYGSQAPDARILKTILAAQPSAPVLPTRGANRSAGAKRALGASGGKAAVTGGFGALKIGLIAAASVTAIALGAFGVSRLVPHTDTPGGGSPNVPSAGVPSLQGETGEQQTGEQPAADSVFAEAAERYRIIVCMASYEFGYIVEEADAAAVYNYALVQMQPDDPVPTLLLEREENGMSSVLLYQYDPVTKSMRHPAEAIAGGVAAAGGYRGTLSIAGDGIGLLCIEWSSGTGDAAAERIVLNGDAVEREVVWTGRIDLIPETPARIAIEWRETDDLSALEGMGSPETVGEAENLPEESGELPADGD